MLPNKEIIKYYISPKMRKQVYICTLKLGIGLGYYHGNYLPPYEISIKDPSKEFSIDHV
jgi:hypothetical protein